MIDIIHVPISIGSTEELLTIIYDTETKKINKVEFGCYEKEGVEGLIDILRECSVY